jgi:transcriptional regulator with XRE-family HTH domain
VIDLAAVRREAGLTQVQLAANLGVGQAHVSKVERQSDMLLSTLASYLSGLDAESRLIVEVAGHTMTFDLETGRGPRR